MRRFRNGLNPALILVLAAILGAEPALGSDPPQSGAAAAKAPIGFAARSAEKQREAEAHALTVPTPNNARRWLRILTAEPHVAGTPADYKTAVFVRDQLREWGWKADIAELEVLLNYPEAPPVLNLQRPTSRRLQSGRSADRDRQGLRQHRGLRCFQWLWRLGHVYWTGRLRELRPTGGLHRARRRWGSTSRTRSCWPATASSFGD